MSTLVATIAFWASAALVAYTYAGYPLWVLLQAWLRPRPVAKGDAQPAVTAILVVHDAERMVEAKIENLLSLDYPEKRFDIVVACDGCSDGTVALCRRYASDRVRVLAWHERRGKARSQAAAVAVARGDVLLVVDVRQRIERDALRRLAGCFSDPGVGVVSGALHFPASARRAYAGVGAYGRYEHAIRDAESRSGSVVGVTAALFAIRRALFRPSHADIRFDDALVPLVVARAGYRAVFEPAAIAWDRASPDSASERNRRVQAMAGSYQMLSMAPWLLHPRHNRLWFRYASHKLMRLAAPWLLSVLAAASAWLAPTHPFYLACLSAGIACVSIALVGPRLPVLSNSLIVRTLSAFWRVNVHSGRALLAYVRNPGLRPW
ncbi:glycosyltransferase [Luteimonas aestuarii]|uniref:Glycosyltransferase n=1 Tax=Luteimonas aestuarii TaxID=453837 RepID=A0A4V3AN64_9GAMM|nr:glycosyltransferase [Luteimonas aestuarii]TDK28505.1 glycosyltransferase [Luteimonas aestuarii]